MLHLVLLLHTRGQQKFDWVHRIPYLLARVNVPAIADECLRQYDSTSSNHHPLSVKVLDADGMRCLVERVKDGFPIDPSLEKVRKHIARVSLDDSVAEGPHAQAKLRSSQRHRRL